MWFFPNRRVLASTSRTHFDCLKFQVSWRRGFLEADRSETIGIEEKDKFSTALVLFGEEGMWK